MNTQQEIRQAFYQYCDESGLKVYRSKRQNGQPCAWTIWIYFMLLRHFSGGWTYIIRPKHEMDVSNKGYASIF